MLCMVSDYGQRCCENAGLSFIVEQALRILRILAAPLCGIAFLAGRVARLRRHLGHRGAQLLDRLGNPGQLHVVAVDDVLVGVVGVVLDDEARSRLMTQIHRQLVAVEVLQQRDEVAHVVCFSLQVMQTRVHGIALSRAAAIGSPQSRHWP